MVFNDLFCLQRPQVHTLSIGAAKPSDFDEHVKAVSLLEQADALVPPIDRRLRNAMIEALGADWMAGWQEGVPEWKQVPGQINILEITRLWNFAKSLDMVEFAKMRYNLLGNGGHWFPGLSAANLSEHDLRSCLEQSPFAGRVIEVLAEAHRMLAGEERKRLGKD